MAATGSTTIWANSEHTCATVEMQTASAHTRDWYTSAWSTKGPSTKHKISCRGSNYSPTLGIWSANGTRTKQGEKTRRPDIVPELDLLRKQIFETRRKFFLIKMR